MKKIFILSICFLMVPFFIRNNCEAYRQTYPINIYTYAAEQVNYYKDTITYKVIDAPQNTFGYNIYRNGRLIIHQPSIPGISGNTGFAKRSDAEKVARLIKQKLTKNSGLPTISLDEMKALGVIWHSR